MSRQECLVAECDDCKAQKCLCRTEKVRAVDHTPGADWEWVEFASGLLLCKPCIAARNATVTAVEGVAV